MEIKSADPFYREICQPLWYSISETWDADDGMEDEYVLSLPQGKFVSTVYELDPEMVNLQK